MFTDWVDPFDIDQYYGDMGTIFAATEDSPSSTGYMSKHADSVPSGQTPTPIVTSIEDEQSVPTTETYSDRKQSFLDLDMQSWIIVLVFFFLTILFISTRIQLYTLQHDVSMLSRMVCTLKDVKPPSE